MKIITAALVAASMLVPVTATTVSGWTWKKRGACKAPTAKGWNG